MLDNMNFRIKNAVSSRTGKGVPNQFFGWYNDVEFFQSYDTPIIEVDHENLAISINCGIVSLGRTSGKAYRCSNTTRKYLKMFLNKAFGDNGNYVYQNLDKLIEKGEVTFMYNMMKRTYKIIKVNE